MVFGAIVSAVVSLLLAFSTTQILFDGNNTNGNLTVIQYVEPKNLTNSSIMAVVLEKVFLGRFYPESKSADGKPELMEQQFDQDLVAGGKESEVVADQTETTSSGNVFDSSESEKAEDIGGDMNSSQEAFDDDLNSTPGEQNATTNEDTVDSSSFPSAFHVVVFLAFGSFCCCYCYILFKKRKERLPPVQIPAYVKNIINKSGYDRVMDVLQTLVADLFLWIVMKALSFFLGKRRLVSWDDLTKGETSLEGLSDVWLIFVLLFIQSLLSCFPLLVRGFMCDPKLKFRLINYFFWCFHLGWEVPVFYLLFSCSLMIIPSLNTLSFGLIKILFENVINPIMNLVTFKALDAQFSGEPWVFGAAIVTSLAMVLVFSPALFSFICFNAQFYLMFNYNMQTAGLFRVLTSAIVLFFPAVLGYEPN